MSTSSSLLVHNCTIFLPWMLEIWWSMQRSQYEGERSSCWVTNYIIANIIIIIIMIIIREMDKTGNLLLPRLLSPLSPLAVLLRSQRRHLLLNLKRRVRASSQSIFASLSASSLSSSSTPRPSSLSPFCAPSCFPPLPFSTEVVAWWWTHPRLCTHSTSASSSCGCQGKRKLVFCEDKKIYDTCTRPHIGFGRRLQNQCFHRPVHPRSDQKFV